MNKSQNTLPQKAGENPGELLRQSNRPQCKGQGQIVRCSAGHEYDLSLLATRFLHGDPKEGGRCPMILSYDKLCGGSKTCRRVLRRSDIPNTKPSGGTSAQAKGSAGDAK